VSRGWDFGENYVLFDWDNMFLSLMASALSKDLAYSNLIQIVLARTQDGFVPNYASGLHKSYDRTEPQVCKARRGTDATGASCRFSRQ
jgi:hypothetical protein